MHAAGCTAVSTHPTATLLSLCLYTRVALNVIRYGGFSTADDRAGSEVGAKVHGCVCGGGWWVIYEQLVLLGGCWQCRAGLQALQSSSKTTQVPTARSGAATASGSRLDAELPEAHAPTEAAEEAGQHLLKSKHGQYVELPPLPGQPADSRRVVIPLPTFAMRAGGCGWTRILDAVCVHASCALCYSSGRFDDHPNHYLTHRRRAGHNLL